MSAGACLSGRRLAEPLTIVRPWRACVRTQIPPRRVVMSDEEEEVVDPKITETAKCEKTQACAKALVAYEHCAERIEKKGRGDCAGFFSALASPEMRRAPKNPSVLTFLERQDRSPSADELQRALLCACAQWTTLHALISA